MDSTPSSRRFRPVLTITVAAVLTVAVAVALVTFGRPSKSLAAAGNFSLAQLGHRVDARQRMQRPPMMTGRQISRPHHR